jgi:hypothetical protein
VWKVTRKGLICGWQRFLLTAIEVILKSPFISDLRVPATIQHTFDDLIGNIYGGTGARVRGPEIFRTIGEARLSRVRRSPPRQSSFDAWGRRAERLQIFTRSWSNPTAR